MRGISRTLIYFLFLVVILYFISLRAQRSQTVELARFPIAPLNGIAGEAIFKKRGDGSQVLVIRLKDAPPEKTIVILFDKEGIGRELGRFSGATFVYSLPTNLSFEKLKKIQLRSAISGRILAEVNLTSPKGAKNGAQTQTAH
ncbi:hypothetical protein [Thermodesulfatator atlanticus]|uniref:hypothetical protein n=1 Tax=Thermodesulfatator atlanticus TaxID=501497 RepID=UPI000409F86D|nr:hypothetical protein [Thermodesulfatator atlanticus]